MRLKTMLAAAVLMLSAALAPAQNYLSGSYIDYYDATTGIACSQFPPGTIMVPQSAATSLDLFGVQGGYVLNANSGGWGTGAKVEVRISRMNVTTNAITVGNWLDVDQQGNDGGVMVHDWFLINQPIFAGQPDDWVVIKYEVKLYQDYTSGGSTTWSRIDYESVDIYYY